MADEGDGNGTVGYRWHSAEATGANQYLLPEVVRLLMTYAPPPARVFDLGCGNGYITQALCSGWVASGVDGSAEGVAQARSAYPGVEVHVASVYDDLAKRFGRFPAIVSLEVVEHLYDPRKYAARMFDLLEPGGVAIISTPFHGYWKNLAMAVTGRMDRHFTALWDHGHIKFWSYKTLGFLLTEAGFEVMTWRRVGRVPALAKSMIAVARRPK
jgi:2-polyprenyl-6-hydroxyphenyl methylase/3-demethylubiquinone-9 3-methyltransferase